MKRIYASSKIALSMRWHNEDRTKDGILRHPIDSLEWKKFDNRDPDFISNIHSIRLLGLVTDDFNPF